MIPPELYRVPEERRRLPLTLQNLTAEEAMTLTNGCGGRGSLRVPSYVWEVSCREHDLAYFVGGTSEDRKAADKRFYESMVAQLETKPWYRRPWLRGAAWRYYLAVRWFGAKYFNYGRQRGWDELELEISRSL